MMIAENEPLKAKIKTAQLEKIPYMVIIGDKDMENNVISIRARDGKQETMTFDAFAEKLSAETK